MNAPRVVVVSGGGTGIGRGVAERFAADGDQVVIVGRRPDVLTEAGAAIGAATGTEPHTVVADLTDPARVAALRDEFADRYNRVDVLVNAAGGNAEFDRPAEPVAAVERALWGWTANFRLNSSFTLPNTTRSGSPSVVSGRRQATRETGPPPQPS